MIHDVAEEPQSEGSQEPELPQLVIQVAIETVVPGGRSTAVRRLPGSFSNESHCIEGLSVGGEGFRLVVRRYAKSGGDCSGKARREYQALGLVRVHGIPAPEPLYLDETGRILGSPGIVTSFVHGGHLVDPPDPIRFARVMASTLAAVHSISLEQPPPTYLVNANVDALWFLQGGRVPAFMSAHPLGSDVWRAVDHLAKRMQSVPPALLHLDWWPGNLLWDGEQISAVVDWEEAAYGDPAVDVGYARMNLVLLGLDKAAEALAVAYETAMGQQPANLTLWELAASARPMRDPAGVAAELRALGASRASDDAVRDRLERFIEETLSRVHGLS